MEAGTTPSVTARFVDAFGPPIKIKQFTINDIPIDYNFKMVTRYDRCTTCHLGIDRPAYTKDALLALTKEPTPEQQKRLDEAREMLKERVKAYGALPPAHGQVGCIAAARSQLACIRPGRSDRPARRRASTNSPPIRGWTCSSVPTASTRRRSSAAPSATRVRGARTDFTLAVAHAQHLDAEAEVGQAARLGSATTCGTSRCCRSASSSRRA